LIKDFGWALARRASDRAKLLARAQNLLVPDDRTGFFSSPEFTLEYDFVGFKKYLLYHMSDKE